MNKNPYIAKAIKILHGQTSLAHAIGRTQPMIWKLLNKKARVTAETALLIEAATAGQVTRYDLRPDVFGPKPKESRASHRRSTDASDPDEHDRGAQKDEAA